MASYVHRADIPPRADPHGWNSKENYIFVHERRLNEHPFVVSFQDTLQFRFMDNEAILGGFVRCQGNIVLEVTKKFRLRTRNGRTSMRCERYRYIGRELGRHTVLKYHNFHADPNEYVHRVCNPETGSEIRYEVLARYQFPTFVEVLDELAVLARKA